MGFVSEAYCKNAGYTMAEDGVLSLSLNKMPDDFYRIQKDVELNENQSFGGAVSHEIIKRFSYRNGNSIWYSLSLAAAICLFTMFCIYPFQRIPVFTV